jgi:sulfite dehydrogenase (cytochrome) subunit B
MRIFPCSLVVVALLTQASQAEPLTYVLPEETATLRPGPDMETARDICVSCHSVDYINTQPPRSGKEFWEGEVKKMIKSYHATISEADAKTIADYLAKTY